MFSTLDWVGGRPSRQTPIRSQGPQVAKVIPALAWMLTNRVWPSGTAPPAIAAVPVRTVRRWIDVAGSLGGQWPDGST